jgi:hypothetical protein
MTANDTHHHQDDLGLVALRLALAALHDDP